MLENKINKLSMLHLTYMAGLFPELLERLNLDYDDGEADSFYVLCVMIVMMSSSKHINSV